MRHAWGHKLPRFWLKWPFCLFSILWWNFLGDKINRMTLINPNPNYNNITSCPITLTLEVRTWNCNRQLETATTCLLVRATRAIVKTIQKGFMLPLNKLMCIEGAIGTYFIFWMSTKWERIVGFVAGNNDKLPNNNFSLWNKKLWVT